MLVKQIVLEIKAICPCKKLAKVKYCLLVRLTLSIIFNLVCLVFFIYGIFN
jgi:hypothetical protein